VEGAQVTYTVTAQDNVDGTAMLEEEGDEIYCSKSYTLQISIFLWIN
jgi:hypothetical protein